MSAQNSAITTTPDLAVSNSLADLAARIRAEHEAALLFIKRGLEHAINAGRLLIEAKAQLAQLNGGSSHRRWLPWLEENAIPARTATHYMRLARHAPDLEAKSATVADLTVRGALELLAPPRRASDFPHWRDWAESFDDIEEWAETTSREPFTDYDFDTHNTHKNGRLTAWKHSIAWKLATVAGAPAEAVFLLQLGEDLALPTEHALTADHIHDLTKAVVPYAKGEKVVQIEAKNPLHAALILKLEAQCLIGLMFREIEEREGLSAEELDDRAQRVMDDVIASLDALREAIQRNKCGETVDCEGRRGTAWGEFRALQELRQEQSVARSQGPPRSPPSPPMSVDSSAIAGGQS